MTFDDLKQRYVLPNSYFFRYIQPRHAFCSQFGGDPLDLETSDLELLTCRDSLSKPVSSLYKDLFPDTVVLLRACRQAWEAAAPGLDRDDIWGAPFQCLISTRDCLILYTFLHRIYLTPARLDRMFRSRRSFGGVRRLWQTSCTFLGIVLISSPIDAV